MNKKSKLLIIGLVLISMGAIGLIGAFFDDEDIKHLIIGSLILISIGVILLILDKRNTNKTVAPTETNQILTDTTKPVTVLRKYKPLIFFPQFIELFSTEYKRKYQYDDVELTLINSSNIPLENNEELTLAIINDEVYLTKDNSTGQFLINNKKISEMAHDFAKRNEPVKAIVSDVSKPSVSIAFYKLSPRQQAEKRKAEEKHMTIKLVGNKSAEIQENISCCYQFDTVEIELDLEGEKFEVLCNNDLIGYIPKGKENIFETNFSYEAFISEIIELDNDKLDVSIMVFGIE